MYLESIYLENQTFHYDGLKWYDKNQNEVSAQIMIDAGIDPVKYLQDCAAADLIADQKRQENLLKKAEKEQKESERQAALTSRIKKYNDSKKARDKAKADLIARLAKDEI